LWARLVYELLGKCRGGRIPVRGRDAPPPGHYRTRVCKLRRRDAHLLRQISRAPRRPGRMKPPFLERAKAAVEFYRGHVVGHEAVAGDLRGLPTDLADYYRDCFDEAQTIYGRFSNRPSGSSTFRPSTTPVSMSLAGSRFSSESAPRPFHHGIRRRGGTIFWATLPSM
jgi:hypothetical protein